MMPAGPASFAGEDALLLPISEAVDMACARTACEDKLETISKNEETATDRCSQV
jgi:hypothetical protein